MLKTDDSQNVPKYLGYSEKTEVTGEALPFISRKTHAADCHTSLSVSYNDWNIGHLSRVSNAIQKAGHWSEFAFQF